MRELLYRLESKAECRLGSLINLIEFAKEPLWIRDICKYDIHRLHKQLLFGVLFN